MKKICVLCNKKIGSFDVLSMNLNNEKGICSNCLRQFNATVVIPSKNTDYSFNKRVYDAIKKDNLYKNMTPDNRNIFESTFNEILYESKKKYNEYQIIHENKSFEEGSNHENVEESDALEEKAKKQIITTAPTISGYEITDYIDIITSEYTLGTGIASSVTSSFADMFGAESEAYTSKVHYAKKIALYRLREESARYGGDGVIAVQADIEVFSRDIIVATCTGTCVKLKKI